MKNDPTEEQQQMMMMGAGGVHAPGGPLANAQHHPVFPLSPAAPTSQVALPAVPPLGNASVMPMTGIESAAMRTSLGSLGGASTISNPISAPTNTTIPPPATAPPYPTTTTTTLPPVQLYVPPSHPTHRSYEETPLKKLSVNLLKTYKHINEVYYEAKRRRQAAAAAAGGGGANPAVGGASSGAAASGANVTNDGHDDENSDYKIIAGERLNNRYVVESKIGKGSFGQVVRAMDEVTKTQVAIKIIKSKTAFRKQAQIEIALLRALNGKDPEDTKNIVRLLDIFEHHKHQCLVFEMLSLNLYDLLRNTQFKGVSLELIRKFAREILRALEYLASPGLEIIHCDLKPENVLLRAPKRSAIKVIDFGSSCYSHSKAYTYIQSRFYRSPEVMLGCPYSCAIDMWSLGCILIEMHTGEPLFAGQDEMEQIHLLVGSRGMPPEPMLRQGKKTLTFFEEVPNPSFAGAATTTSTTATNASADVKVPPTPARTPSSGRERETFYRLKPMPPGKRPSRYVPMTLETALGIAPGCESGPYVRRRAKNEPGHDLASYLIFVDLLDRMLAYDPEKRIKPTQALNHPFLYPLASNFVAPNSTTSTVAGSPAPAPSTTSSQMNVVSGGTQRPMPTSASGANASQGGAMESAPATTTRGKKARAGPADPSATQNQTVTPKIRLAPRPGSC